MARPPRTARPRRGPVAALAACGALLLLVLTGCSSGAGVRVEQSAAASALPENKLSALPATPSPSPESSGEGTPEESDGASPRPETSDGQDPAPDTTPAPAAPAVSPPGAQRDLDVITLLRRDPSVGADVKDSLQPCAGHWPVDVSFGRLTGKKAADMVVNVTGCADGTGLGSYVYRETPSGRYVNVFTEEETSVYAQVERTSLRVYQQIYLDDDPLCCPSGQDVVTYTWRGGKFSELDRVYKDYPKPTESGPEDGED